MVLAVCAACAACAGCAAEPTAAPRTFDPCMPVEIGAVTAVSTEEAASIDAAIALWRQRDVTGLARGDAPEIQVVFRAAAASFYGVYDGETATIYINTAVSDPEQRAIAIAHELGHALGLVHVDPGERPSVMNPGNLTIAPNAEDGAELARIWGTCTARPPASAI